MSSTRHNWDKLIEDNPGYTQIPNCIYSLNISKHAKLVFPYLIRCANRQKGGTCFPSINNISVNCSIPSETTVRAAIQELHDKGLITKVPLGRRNSYKICKQIYIAIDKANGKEGNYSMLEDNSSYSDAFEHEEGEYASVETNSDAIPAEYEEIPPQNVDEYHHHVLSNKTKGTRLNNNIKKEDQNSENPNFDCMSINRNESTKGKNSSYAEANQYYQSLTERDKISFDIAARELIRSDEADPKTSLVSKRTVRCRFYELLKQEPQRHDGFENYYVPIDEMEHANEPRRYSTR